MRALVMVMLLFFAAPVAAQEAEAESAPASETVAAPVPAPPVESPAPEPIASDVRYLDASVNRVVWLPTAETNPEGTFFFGIYELLGLQFGYAISDDIEFALTGVIPIDELPYAFDLSIKWNVFRGNLFRIGLFGSLGVYVSDAREEAIGGRAGASFQLCFNEDCTSHATLSGGALITNHIDTSLPFVVGLGAVVRVHDYVALVLEPLYGRVEMMNPEDVFVLNYVVRIGHLDWSLDVGLTRPFVEELESGPFVAGFPWLAFNYRLGWEP